jgi:hypothetical protein
MANVFFLDGHYLVVKPQLGNFQLITRHAVHHAVFVINSAGPKA